MNELKCPFCQQKLVRHWGMKEPALYCCDNPKCSRGGVATESSWQELMLTRKALELAIDTINKASDALIGCQEADNKYISDITAEDGLELLGKALGKIRLLQKDVK